MITTLQVQHYVHVTDRSFEDVLSDLKKTTGSIEEGFQQIADTTSGKQEFIDTFKAREGSSGFMRFLPIDHGGWLGNFSGAKKAVMYVIGNPLIAVTMLEHDIAAGLNVPTRIYVFEGYDGQTRVAYDLPSTLMGDIENPALIEAAKKLDDKLIALATDISGVSA